MKSIFIKDNSYYRFFMALELVFLSVSICFYVFLDSFKINYTLLDVLTVVNALHVMLGFAYCILANDIKSKFALLCFYIAYFVLLLGQFLFNLADHREWGRVIFQTVSPVSLYNEAKGQLLLLVSQVVILLANLYSSREHYQSLFSSIESHLHA